MNQNLSLQYKKLLENEKNEDRERMHSFHRYFGKLIPAIPRFAIKQFTEKNDIVLDCFCGSGTTLVEAKLLDRNSYGMDLNPLSTLIANVKANPLKKEQLNNSKDVLLKNIKKDKSKNKDNKFPYCVNIDHWFKDFVKKDLIIIYKNIEKIKDKGVKNFFKAVFSSFLRDVSNADPKHIFPGYSKRLRELDRRGLREINVIPMFEKKLNNRIEWSDKMKFRSNGHIAKAIIGDARSMKDKIPEKVDLIVTNPPYISSIRYLETLKLEMYWLEEIMSQDDYLKLDKQIIGTERFYKEELENLKTIGITKVDKIIKKLASEDNKKMAMVVQKYFYDMQQVFNGMNEILNTKGRVVMKISDSFIRGINVPTTDILVEIAKNNGFTLEARFKDEIHNRSLMTKRNYYSKMIPYDWIIIFRKLGK